MARFEEVMSGRDVGDDAPDDFASDSDDGEPTNETEAHAPRPKGRRMRRFEEIMSGRPIPDPEADSGGESADTDQ